MPIASQYTSSTAYSNTDLPHGSLKPLPVIGMMTIKVQQKDRSNTAKFYIVSGNGGNLPSLTISENLGILHITRKLTSKASTAQIVINFPDDFTEGIGKISGQAVKLHINPEVILN